MKCFVCNQRKGKRTCPAGAALICAQCCGEKRVIEIPCPADCSYLVSGQSREFEKNFMALLAFERDPTRRQKLFEVRMQLGGFVSLIELQIVSYARGLSTMDDSVIQDAIQILRKTYETEQRGVIFEHASQNPIAQSLARELRDFLENSREGEDEGVPRIPLSDILDCLEVVQADVDYHLRQVPEVNSYLMFIKRNYPQAGKEDDQPGLIYP